jgi:predicted helicase
MISGWSLIKHPCSITGGYMHILLERYFHNWKELESEIAKIDDNLEKGTVFEEFIYFYFLYFNDLYQINEIYAPIVTKQQFPEPILTNLQLENKDHGVDGVYIKTDGTQVAYQVKFRSDRSSATAKELSTFWAEAEYADYRCVIANCYSLPKVSSKKKNHLSIIVDKLDALPEAFFSALKSYAESTQVKAPDKYSPRTYQEEIINNVVQGFKYNSRGKLIAACGIGKTLVSLWVKEKMNSNATLFIAPTLTLIRQTLGHWLMQSNKPFQYICVCSDETVAVNVANDIWDVTLDEMDVPVTTDQKVLGEQLSKLKGNVVVFSTYQSLNVVSDACSNIGFSFDITICDEAHRTAGVRNSELFSLALYDININSKYRLFMTATERLVKSGIKKRIEDVGRIVFSMDDENVYGPILHKLDFGDAIKDYIISDYRVVLAGINNNEIDAFVAENKYLTQLGDSKIFSAQTLFNRLLLLKSISELGLKKVISYHSSVAEAKSFTDFIQRYIPQNKGKTFVGHINGSTSAAARANLIREFEESDLGVLTNVRCLTEGVDIPLIDAVYFSDPKSSLIDIVQAVGRAVRQKYGQKGNISYIVIPVLFGGHESDLSEEFEEFFNVIQSLRDQDSSLAEWIDSINAAAVKGKVGGKGSHKISKISAILPEEVDVDNFLESITLEIAEVNKNPQGTVGIGSKLGKKERISTFKRVFKTLGDYTPIKYQESLVNPTIDKIADTVTEYSREKIAFNNNNVSHTERLGLIELNNNKKFTLTGLGSAYKSCALTFNEVFKNQMLKYSLKSETLDIYPYRIALDVLKVSKTINYHEFLYGLYSLQPKDNQSKMVEDVIEGINNIRNNFPNLKLTSEANKEDILEQLNSTHPVGFNYNDVWTDRTTTANQYRYFRRHLELFDAFIKNDASILEIDENGIGVMNDYLKRSINNEVDNFYSEMIWIK